MPGRNGYFANCELVLPKVVECAEAIVVDTPMYDSETMPAFRGTVSTFLSKPGSGRGSGTAKRLVAFNNEVCTEYGTRYFWI